MQTLRIDSEAALKRAASRLARPPRFKAGQDAAVARIMEAVRLGGDAALLGYAARLDGTRLKARELRLPPARLRQALDRLDPQLKKALKASIANITAFQRRILPKGWEASLRPGVRLGQQVRPLKRVGICVPGGESPLVSTVLMSAIPARVAGVREVVVVTPNRYGQGINQDLLAAAALCGVTEVYQVGGAHAVAALAFGTASIPRVDKIVGPGSSWVAAAQRLAFGTVGIDMVAGPSEIMVIAERGADPAWVAADMLSQAEHAGEESAVLVTPDAALARQVVEALRAQAQALPRQSAIRSSLARFGLALVVRSLSDAVALADAMAPEHLELMVRQPRPLARRIHNAGAIFMGRTTPEPVGDYLAGPSHVLPTGGCARYASGLSVENFVKKSSLLEYAPAALKREGPAIRRMALAEGLSAHAASVAARGC
jgi:histidinol dehydrogenase